MRESLRNIASSVKESRILVAEDNAVDQRVIQLMLQRAGYSADVVCNGGQAVAAFHAQHYDLVLMDCLMPEMGGLEAVRRIRQLEERQPAIVAITAYIKAGYREQCFESGVDDYLAKPYHWHQLLQIVRENLQRSSPPLRMGNHQ